MKLPLPPDFFAPVRLAAAEVRDLQQVQAQLLASYLAQYDAYASNEPQDPAWRLAGQRAGVKIFTQRPQRGSRRRRRRTVGGSASLPSLRVVGSLDGALEDVLYGAMWRCGRERAARAHFTRDGVADGAVLCAVEKPSPAEPFRSLSVKWTLKRAPHGGLVVKDRDFCYLAASGVVISPRTGRKLGFRLRHSMTFPSCPPFQNHSVVRGQIFLCSFFRQLHNGRVEVFHQGSYDAGGGGGTIGLSLPRSIAEKSVVESLLSLDSVQSCALAKKLSRAVESCEAERVLASLSCTSVQESLDGERRCGMCLRCLGSTIKRRCAACRHWTCSQCSVRQETLLSTRGSSMKGPISPRCFCKACVAKVLRDDATEYAAQDASHDGYDTTGGRWGHDDIPEEVESDEEELYLSGTRHSVVFQAASQLNLFDMDELSRPRRAMTATPAPSATLERGDRSSGLRLSAKQVSVGSSVNTVSSSPPGHRRRSATLAAMPTTMSSIENRFRRSGVQAPDILLRSDVGRRNWASSISALSLQSPQRHIDGSPIVNVQRTPRRRLSGSASQSVRRASFGSSCSSGGKSDDVRVRICTPRRSQPAAAYTPYFAAASSRTPPQREPRSRAQQQFFRNLYR